MENERKININVVSLKLVKEKNISISMGNKFDVVSSLSNLIKEKDREYFVVISLNTKLFVNSINVVSIGSVNSTIVHPREVFKVAVLSNATCIIVAHNHPSGDVMPSREDIDVTHRLKEASEIMGITLLDHIIVAFQNPEIYSFKENGLI
ncbi:JAB domain-containing protein [Clostridium sp.]|uniref:JAB domain-containing protein n=1 Tax=Clostridium sp. TaxID=1506 RepID=UPI0035A039A5